MSSTHSRNKKAAEFRNWLIARLEEDDRFGDPDVEDEAESDTLTTRWSVGEDLYLEVTLRPALPQLRIGIVTDDRWKSGEIEREIADSADSLEEYMEQAFGDAGLDWEEPPVEHYRSLGTWYCFITPVDLRSLDELSDSKLRQKVERMVDAYADSLGQV